MILSKNISWVFIFVIYHILFINKLWIILQYPQKYLFDILVDLKRNSFEIRKKNLLLSSLCEIKSNLFWSRSNLSRSKLLLLVVC